MIIVELIGGLGNQMFQYAAGRSLALKYQVPLKLDTKYLLDRSNSSKDFVFRNYDLGIWNIDEEFVTEEEMLEVTGQSRIPLSFIQKIHLRIKKATIDYSQQSYKETHFEFDENFYHKTPPLYLQGYWQSEKYFASIADTIRKDFTFKNFPLQANDPLMAEIRTQESVCLNVRRGDFVSIPKTSQYSGFVGLEYLHKGAEYIAKKIEKPHFFIFSDEIEWCKKYIHLDFPCTFVSNDKPLATFQEDFAYMQNCKHFIISNSSFAWWAAWLATYSNKIIITPNQWFANKTLNTKDLIPPTWIKI